MNKRSFTIADCFSFIKNGANIKQDKEKRGYPITRIETTSNNVFNRDKVGYAGIEDITPYQDYVLEDGDLLMSHINSLPYLGRVVYYDRKQDEIIIHGMNLLRLKAIKTRLRPKYATFLFSSIRFKNKILTIAKKSVNQASFSINDLKKVCIELPTVEEQDNIVDKLVGIQKIIQLRNAQLARLDELVKCRFVELFGDPVSNPMGWATKRIHEVAPHSPIEIKTESNDIWLLNLDKIESHTGRVTEYVYIHPDEIGTSTCGFDCRHVLYSKLRPYLNKVVVPNQSGMATSELLALCPNEELNREFLAHLLRSDNFVGYISEKVAGAKMPRVSMDIFRAFPCILPPMTLQNTFVSFVQRIDKLRFVIQKSLDETQTLFNSLMQQYFD